MKLLPKFTLLSFAVCAIPLAIAGYSAARIGQRAIRDGIEQNEGTVARQVAEHVSQRLQGLVATMRVETRILGLTRAAGAPAQLPRPEVLRKFLELVYFQSSDFSAVALLDEQGHDVVAPAFQENPRENTALGRHEAMRAADVERIGARTPVDEALRTGVGVGPVFVAGPEGTPQIVLALRYDFSADEEAKILAAQVSLRPIQGYLGRLGGGDRRVLLLDRASRVVVASAGTPGADALPLAAKRLPEAMPDTLPDHEFVREYDSGPARVIGAYASVEPFPLGVVAERPLGSALARLVRMKWATIYWMTISGLIAAAVAAFLARGLTKRVEDLVFGARQIAQGKLDTQLAVRSSDELGELARAFNAMATSLEAARNEILRQTHVIKAWNESLERRVEEKTKELRQAQDLLLRSRSLAAIGGLGAGMAHEINNPLTGVLGLAQLVLADLPADHPMRPMVGDIEHQALRIQGIVSNLLRLSQREAGEDFRRVDLAQVIDDALELCGRSSFKDAGLSLELRVTRPSPPVRGSSVQLQAAIIQIIQNARAAMEAGGTLTLETSLPDAKLLRLRITDTGRGIKPEHLPRIFDPFFTTKNKWNETGMGLAVVHKIIEDHGGTISAESQPGAGTTFWITLPIDAGAAHLT